MNKAESFALGVMVGAGAVYILDPDKGRRRRALLRDRVVHTRNELDQAARTGGRRIRNRAVGLAHELKADLTEREVDDRVLEERVRSEVGRTISNPGALQVTAEGGYVTLSGTVPAAEVQELVRAARAVRGVHHVDNDLRVETHPQSVPELQGVRDRR